MARVLQHIGRAAAPGFASIAAFAFAVVLVGGCKKPPEGPVENGADGSGGEDAGFIDISLEPEGESLDDLMGSELIQATAKCGDLVALEPSAMMGKLKDGEIRCLEDSLRDAEKQTVKDKISRVLQADAWAKGDLHRWETIVRRHLNDIDRSDADLCYKFAKHLSGRGPEYADETMHWAEVALENRTQWTGETHVSRVNSLYKLRAVSSQQKWSWLETKWVETPTEELTQEKEVARNMAKTQAREWLEYARSAGKDPTMAMQLCISAAGTSEFCEDTSQ